MTTGLGALWSLSSSPTSFASLISFPGTKNTLTHRQEVGVFEALDEEIGLTPGDGRKEGLCIWRNRLFLFFFSLFSAHGAFHNWRAETIGNMENVGKKKRLWGRC